MSKKINPFEVSIASTHTLNLFEGTPFAQSVTVNIPESKGNSLYYEDSFQEFLCELLTESCSDNSDFSEALKEVGVYVERYRLNPLLAAELMAIVMADRSFMRALTTRMQLDWDGSFLADIFADSLYSLTKATKLKLLKGIKAKEVYAAHNRIQKPQAELRKKRQESVKQSREQALVAELKALGYDVSKKKTAAGG